MDVGDRLAAYLARLGLAAPPTTDADGLAALQLAHRKAIAFENLDIRLGRGIAIDGRSVFAKLVSAGRGGYCFEQNRLYADMLAAVGLPSRPLLARVLLGLPDPIPFDSLPPRTHVLLLVRIGDEDWIADAGFGGSYVPPLPLREGAAAVTHDGAEHRLRRVDGNSGAWLLERCGPAGATDGRGGAGAGWQRQYAFDLSPVAPADLEQANHWTSSRPDTRFTTVHVVSRVEDGGFASLNDRSFSAYGRDGRQQAEITDAAAYSSLLQRRFALAFDVDLAARLPLFA